MGWIDKYKEVIPKAQKGKLVSNKDFETPPEGFLYPKEWQNWWLDNRSNTVRSLAKEAGIPSEGIIEKAKNKINTLPEYKIKDSSPNAYYLREGKIGKSNLNSHAAYLGYNSLIPLSVGIHEPTHGISDVLPEELEEVNISNIVNNATRTNNPELKKYFKDKDYYYKTPWEVKARLNEFRYLYGLDPKRNYTVDDIKNIINNPPNREFLEKSRKGSRGADDLLNMFTPEEILELHNKTVLNKSNNLDKYILPKAQNGLQLNNSTNNRGLTPEESFPDIKQWHKDWIEKRQHILTPYLERNAKKNQIGSFYNKISLENALKSTFSSINGAKEQAKKNFEFLGAYFPLSGDIIYDSPVYPDVRVHELSHAKGNASNVLGFLQNNDIKKIVKNRERTKNKAPEYIQNHYKYYTSPEEVSAYLDQWRYLNRINPTKQYSIEEISGIVEKAKQERVNKALMNIFVPGANYQYNKGHSVIEDLFTPKEILNLHNTVVMNDKNVNSLPTDRYETNVYKAQYGGIIKDNNGYWNPDNWGKPVEIASNNITMRGVGEPLLGISDTGDLQYMSPGNDYKFKGSKVTEIPMAQEGLKKEPLYLSKPKLEMKYKIPTQEDISNFEFSSYPIQDNIDAKRQELEDLKKQEEYEKRESEINDAIDKYTEMLFIPSTSDPKGTINIRDNRVIDNLTGKKLSDKRRMHSIAGKSTIENLVKGSIERGIDPYTAIAIGMQETNLGLLANPLHHNTLGIRNNKEDYLKVTPTPEGAINESLDFLKKKFDYAKKLGKKSDEEIIQAWNGYGKPWSLFEDYFYGKKQDTIKPMSENPIYGKKIVNLRDSVIKKNPEIVKIVNDISNKSKQGYYATGGVVKDNDGYWNKNNWGKPVEIDSTNITMKGVPFPLLGVSDRGDMKTMFPGEEYKFEGDRVREFPIAQEGKNVLGNLSLKLEKIGVPLNKQISIYNKVVSPMIDLSKHIPLISPLAYYADSLTRDLAYNIASQHAGYDRDEESIRRGLEGKREEYLYNGKGLLPNDKQSWDLLKLALYGDETGFTKIPDSIRNNITIPLKDKKLEKELSKQPAYYTENVPYYNREGKPSTFEDRLNYGDSIDYDLALSTMESLIRRNRERDSISVSDEYINKEAERQLRGTEDVIFSASDKDNIFLPYMPLNNLAGYSGMFKTDPKTGGKWFIVNDAFDWDENYGKRWRGDPEYGQSEDIIQNQADALASRAKYKPVLMTANPIKGIKVPSKQQGGNVQMKNQEVNLQQLQDFSNFGKKMKTGGWLDKFND